MQVGSTAHTGHFNLVEEADKDNANRAPLATTANPTLRLYSSDATEPLDYIEFTHNQADGVIATGTGDIILNPAGIVITSKTISCDTLSVDSVTFVKTLNFTDRPTTPNTLFVSDDTVMWFFDGTNYNELY